jgi:hypothetical protein
MAYGLRVKRSDRKKRRQSKNIHARMPTLEIEDFVLHVRGIRLAAATAFVALARRRRVSPTEELKVAGCDVMWLIHSGAERVTSDGYEYY